MSGQHTLCIFSLYPKSRKDLTAMVQKHAAGIINIVQLPEPEDMTTTFFISKRATQQKDNEFSNCVGGFSLQFKLGRFH